MITKDNLKELLKKLDYKQNTDIYSYKFAENIEISIDFENEVINYPNGLIINER